MSDLRPHATLLAADFTPPFSGFLRTHSQLLSTTTIFVNAYRPDRAGSIGRESSGSTAAGATFRLVRQTTRVQALPPCYCGGGPAASMAAEPLKLPYVTLAGNAVLLPKISTSASEAGGPERSEDAVCMPPCATEHLQPEVVAFQRTAATAAPGYGIRPAVRPSLSSYCTTCRSWRNVVREYSMSSQAILPSASRK